MNVTAEIERIGEEIKTRVERIKWLKKHRTKLEPLPNASRSSPSGGMDFDNLSHADVVKVIKALGGKWKKLPAHNNTIDYETEVNGTRIRCYQGQPPPSCKIIEVEEFVPEQIIPASIRKVKKMVCAPEVGAIIASAAERGQAQASQNP